MAGLLDWLTDGTLGSNMGGGGGGFGSQMDSLGGVAPGPMPPVQPLDQTPAPPPDMSGNMGRPPQPATASEFGGAPVPDGSTTVPGATGGTIASDQPGAPPPVPIPQARPQIPAPDAETPPGAPTSLAPTAPGISAPPPAGFLPNQQGAGGLFGLMGMNPDTANRFSGALGAGLTAAGNSAGKSPFQALASGGGAAMEGGLKEAQQNTKDAQGWLKTAIDAKKNGDDALFKTATLQYQMAKLKADTDKVTPNKNDSPTQLYLAAQRNAAADPLVKGAFEGLKSAQKDGDPKLIAAAQQRYEQVVTERQQAHLAGVGLHPQTAAQIAQQPGMTKENPIDAAKAGLNEKNFSEKMHVGQYYTDRNAISPTNPQGLMIVTQEGLDRAKNKVVKRDSSSGGKASKPEPFDPTKASKSTPEDDDE